jgi:hypothetical protein
VPGKVKYLGAIVPTVINVLAGNEQQIINVRSAGQVFTFSTVVAAELVTEFPTVWEAAEGWVPPPYEPPEAETLTVSSNYTITGGLAKRVFCNAQAGAFTVKLPSAPYLGQTINFVNTATNGNAVTLEAQVGEIAAPNLAAAVTLNIGKTETYYTVELAWDGSNWHVV